MKDEELIIDKDVLCYKLTDCQFNYYGKCLCTEKCEHQEKTINEYLRSQIDEHCQMVQREAKPLSLLPHQERYYDEIVKIIKSYNLYWSSEINGEGWRTVYIYKNKTIRFLIPELPLKPESASEHALIGYLLGYGTDSICDYILEHCKLDEPNIF